MYCTPYMLKLNRTSNIGQRSNAIGSPCRRLSIYAPLKQRIGRLNNPVVRISSSKLPEPKSSMYSKAIPHAGSKKLCRLTVVVITAAWVREEADAEALPSRVIHPGRNHSPVIDENLQYASIKESTHGKMFFSVLTLLYPRGEECMRC